MWHEHYEGGEVRDGFPERTEVKSANATPLILRPINNLFNRLVLHAQSQWGGRGKELFSMLSSAVRPHWLLCPKPSVSRQETALPEEKCTVITGSSNHQRTNFFGQIKPSDVQREEKK